METFEIYTIGSGYYLEKIFNAIKAYFRYLKITLYQ